MMSFMQLYSIRTPEVKVRANLVELILESMEAQNLRFEDNDILVLTSKIVSYSEGRVVKLSNVKPSKKGRKLAEQYSLEPEFGELVVRESERICGGVDKAVLTLKHGILIANAGIDNKNAPPGHVVLWPADPEKTVSELRAQLLRITGKNVAVMIIDSGLIPLRIGTIGIAIAVAGFKPIADERGRLDLFRRKITITRQAVADDLACAAHLMMGESTQRIPAVVVRDAPVDFDGGVYGSKEMMMPFKECLFMNATK
jgi:coenzyme F420-0:L-glutamate ligase/coenzyme F420-1:gamma-L-glutamate ligase